MDALLGFIIAAVALAGSPGPNTLSLAASGAAFGTRRVLGYMLGLDIGMLAVMGITASGVVGMLMAVPGATPVITVVAGAYFLYLAYRIATAPPISAPASDQAPPSFAAGLLLSLVNPKGYAAMAALFSGFVLVRDRLALDVALKVAVVLVVIATVNVAWLIAGAGLTRFFRDPVTNRAINIIFALLLIASVAVALMF